MTPLSSTTVMLVRRFWKNCECERHVSELKRVDACYPTIVAHCDFCLAHYATSTGSLGRHDGGSSEEDVGSSALLLSTLV